MRNLTLALILFIPLVGLSGEGSGAGGVFTSGARIIDRDLSSTVGINPVLIELLKNAEYLELKNGTVLSNDEILKILEAKKKPFLHEERSFDGKLPLDFD